MTSTQLFSQLTINNGGNANNGKEQESLFLKSFSQDGNLNHKWIKIAKNNIKPFISNLNDQNLIGLWSVSSPLNLVVWDILDNNVKNFSFDFSESFIQ